ncbi:DNA-binding transcription factor yap1 [Coemansia sp. RSA 2322]|nr:DNA-binding transcription factor yap1 [Coemansia sp. RSA 2322]KAJ2480751.1 DNA-binding transcription factor yap1 [Coemansia sp. RSA 2320]
MSTVEVATAGVTPQKRVPVSEGSDDSHDDMMYDDDDVHDEKKFKKPGRKPIMTEAGTKRTAQNRAAQRAFRERKQQYLKGLEDKVKELTEQQERTERENQQLKQFVDKLKEENVTLRSGGQFTYENMAPVVDFDQAISDLFDPKAAGNGGINLLGSYELQQAALRGADLTKPGIMKTIQPSAHGSSDGASPQSVPTLYPNFDLSSVTTGTLVRSLAAQPSGTVAVDHQGALLGTAAPSSLSLGFSSDILSGIQMLASNQDISTGSFMSQLFDSPGGASGGSSSIVPVSPGGPGGSHHVSTSVAGFGNGSGTSRSPSVTGSMTATPGDMFVPLNTFSSSGSSAGSGFFGMDAFKGQNGFAHLAALMQQTSASPESSQDAITPSLSELFTMSPGPITTDGLINYTPSSTVANSAGGLSTADVFSAIGVGGVSGGGPSLSLPDLLQQSAAAYQVQRQLAVGSNMLPAHLMAYRNPDPISVADDGDQLEKLLLNSMYTLKPDSTATTVTEPQPSRGSSFMDSGLAAGALTAAPAVSASDAVPTSTSEETCTCRTCDQKACPKHGSPGDMSEELRDMAPQLLNFVCNETNTMADEELNDLCSLMYKHAKCSEVQRRVEMAREQLKNKSELELLQAKKSLAKQYGLH